MTGDIEYYTQAPSDNNGVTGEWSRSNAGFQPHAMQDEEDGEGEAPDAMAAGAVGLRGVENVLGSQVAGVARGGEVGGVEEEGVPRKLSALQLLAGDGDRGRGVGM